VRPKAYIIEIGAVYCPMSKTRDNPKEIPFDKGTQKKRENGALGRGLG
jgi:hypothetical protein